MKFTIIEKGREGKVIDFTARHIINAGYTGRDQAAVKAHINELKEKGIPAPDQTPTYYVKFPDKMTQAKTFEVLDETHHSGEAEFVLIFNDGEIYVGVGSDHTDRKLEETDIPRAKQIYFNTVGETLWKLSEVVDHWDDIKIRSYIINNGEKMVLQDSGLSVMMAPNVLIDRVKKLLRDPNDIDGLVIYSGTVAALFNADYSSYFECELDDPVIGRKISNAYEMCCIDAWYKGDC